MNLRNTSLNALKTALLILISISLFSCEENPNDLGLTFITSDTTTTRYLDSELDTMQITSVNYKKYINNSTASAFFVGMYNGYVSKPLLKFSNIGPEFDSATVLSAILTMRYNNYAFKDSNGTIAFNVNKVLTNLNYSTITWDSVNSSNIGTKSLGTYSGSPTDTQTISVKLDNNFVKDWLEYAADTNYVNKNYGFMLSPEMSSTSIKGFYSFDNSAEVIPTVQIIISKLGDVDTLNLITSQYVTLTDAPSTIIPPERFVLQNGIAYRNILAFDLSKLPDNVIINNATLTFSIDNALTFTGPNPDRSVVVGMVLDSVTRIDSLFTTVALTSDSVVFTLSSAVFNGFVQRWNLGAIPQMGLSMKNVNESENLDYFVFYSPQASDISRRPRMRITYSLRN